VPALAGWGWCSCFVVVAASWAAMFTTAATVAVVAVVALVVWLPFRLAVFVVVKVVCGLCC
jgi:hypothetical protein